MRVIFTGCRRLLMGVPKCHVRRANRSQNIPCWLSPIFRPLSSCHKRSFRALAMEGDGECCRGSAMLWLHPA